MPEITEGWVPSPNNRGTFDIIRTCFQTIALCAWTSICVNIPAPNHGTFDLLRDKFHFVLLTFLGPEIVFLLAFSQYQSAQASVRLFKEIGHIDWTLTHGFYADMGGIHVRDKAWKSFPVNAKQLHYLVSHNYIKYPSITLRELKDRNKIDGLARVIAVGQALYFSVSTLGRAAQGLAITTIELTVLGFIFCTLATTWCWWSKPTDVQIGHVFDLTVGVHTILREGSMDANDPYRNTPLDFVNHDEWAGTNLWIFYVNCLKYFHLARRTRGDLPIQKFSSIHFKKPQNQASGFICLALSLAYSAIFFAAWNFHFSTKLESLLWRVFCLSQISICFAIGSFELYHFHSFTEHDKEGSGREEFQL